MKATHNGMATIREGRFGRNFKTGYDMAICSNCGNHTRTLHVMLHLECGAEITGWVCKVCIEKPEINDIRTHVHVGDKVEISRARNLADETERRWFTDQVRTMTLAQVTTGLDDALTAVSVPAMTLAVRVCNGGAQ